MHLEQEKLEAFQEGSMDTEEWIQFLEHMSICDYCAGQLDSDKTGQKAPSYLKEQMMQRVQKLDVQTAVTVKRASGKMQLFLYGLKTAAAVLAALIMLFAIPPYDSAPGETAKEPVRDPWKLTRQIDEKSNELTNLLNKFSYRLVKGNGNTSNLNRK